MVVDNHTIDDSLIREGWDPTKRSMRGQRPISVRVLAGRALRKVLSDLGHVKILVPGPEEAALTRELYQETLSLVSHTMLSCVLSYGNSPNLIRISREFGAK